MRIIKNIMVITSLVVSPIMSWGQSPQVRKMNIENMFDMAESNSRNIHVSDMAEKEAEQAVKVARNAKLPAIDASLSGSFLGNGWIADRDFSNGQKAAIPHWGNNFALEASQVIYAGGAISSSIEIAKLQYQSARLDKEKNRQDVRFLLVGNYLEMYKLYNQKEVYLKNIEQTEKLLSDIKAKQAEGLALKNDITRYELELKSLELALTQVENSIIIINNQLVTILHLPPETIIEIDTSLLDNLPAAQNNSDWQDIAENSLPSLQQAKIGIEQSKKSETLVKSERLPSVALFAANHFDGPIIIEVPPINKNMNYWYMGVSIKFNLASIYKSDKKEKLAKLSTQKAIESELLLKENIQTDVKAAHIRFIESFTIYDTQMKSLELATQNYNTVNNRYLNDLALITDMLDASNSKLSAELQVANARINILFNYYRLKKAAGDL
ncbi:TolC family protein [Parabacteroides sp. Marseille-P3160]|uniref:TolC family protein n=1 Tax=Parabacteroides sp. Marseille-P3160 TaxID=1917887 RepID=UPI0009BA9A3D|nr:TolC family protein [Parabacteroides sp. Marseille-P3160]